MFAPAPVGAFFVFTRPSPAKPLTEDAEVNLVQHFDLQ